MAELREPLSEEDSKTTTELVRGAIRSVEVPGAYDPKKPDSDPVPLTLLEPRFLSDYTSAPCKHECGIIKQIEHAKQAHRLLSALNPIKQLFYDRRHGSVAWTRLTATRPQSRMWSNCTALGARKEGHEKQLFSALQLYIVMGC